MPQVSQTQNTALATSLQVKTTAGCLYRLVAYNDSASAQYVQVYDVRTTPTSQTPVLHFKLASKEWRVLTFDNLPLQFTNGIFVGNSSALAYTVGSADCFFTVQYL